MNQTADPKSLTLRELITCALKTRADLTNREVTHVVGRIKGVRYRHPLNGTLIKQVREQLISEKCLMFVYGTLLSGCGNHYTMQRARGRLVAEDEIRAEMFSISVHGGFPFIKLTDNGSTVKGEVYEVPVLHLSVLDSLEGYRPNSPDNSLFIRTTTTTKQGKKVFVYEGRRMDPTQHPKIESGDWREHTKRPF